MDNVDFIDYIDALFYEGEAIFVASQLNADRATFQGDDIPVGDYVGCNPYKGGEERRSPVHPRLVAFRNFVVEFDDMPLKEQYKLIKSLHIPYASMVYSGNKSYHCVVALKDDVGYNKYRDYAARIKRVLPDCDSNCLEPSRTTRAPNGDQTLIALGAKISESELVAWLEGLEKDLPPEIKPKNKSVYRTGVLYDKTLAVLAGKINPDNVQGDLIAAVRNLIEIGFDYDKCLDFMGSARNQNMAGVESAEFSREKSKKLVKWAFNLWAVDET